MEVIIKKKEGLNGHIQASVVCETGGYGSTTFCSGRSLVEIPFTQGFPVFLIWTFETFSVRFEE